MSSNWRESSTVCQDAEESKACEIVCGWFDTNVLQYLCPAEAFLLLTGTSLAKQDCAFSAKGAFQHQSDEVQSPKAEVTPAILITIILISQCHKKGTCEGPGLPSNKNRGPWKPPPLPSAGKQDHACPVQFYLLKAPGKHHSLREVTDLPQHRLRLYLASHRAGPLTLPVRADIFISGTAPALIMRPSAHLLMCNDTMFH